ncbi:hypothetical protein MBOT_10000 [Mycobacterium botniense]|uniref:GAP family protein n=1 Tax=Mycobacterium botniense TaxID=84962 RepID=A0A7I9XUM4_9MYCO|nr:hypothetical protein MBOT_10000 [Mycobacterium botniense]
MVLGLVLALDPVRLGLILLMISRPRPAQSLLAYWVGAMAASVPYMLGPLMVLHVTPTFRSFAQHVASPATFASPMVRHIQIGIGVLALSVAAVMAVRFWAGQRSQLAADGGAAAPTPDSAARPPEPAPDTPRQSQSARRGLRARAHQAWVNGSSWPALMLGAASGPPPLTVLLVLTTIMASGVGIATQIGLALVWVVGMFVVVEVILVSYLAAPAKTQTILRLLHEQILAHRQQVLTSMVAAIGVAMMLYGIGGLGASG